MNSLVSQWRWNLRQYFGWSLHWSTIEIFQVKIGPNDGMDLNRFYWKGINHFVENFLQRFAWEFISYTFQIISKIIFNFHFCLKRSRFSSHEKKIFTKGMKIFCISFFIVQSSQCVFNWSKWLSHFLQEQIGSTFMWAKTPKDFWNESKHFWNSNFDIKYLSINAQHVAAKTKTNLIQLTSKLEILKKLGFQRSVFCQKKSIPPWIISSRFTVYGRQACRLILFVIWKHVKVNYRYSSTSKVWLIFLRVCIMCNN